MFILVDTLAKCLRQLQHCYPRYIQYLFKFGSPLIQKHSVKGHWVWLAPVWPPIWFVLPDILRGPGLPAALHPGTLALAVLLICLVGDNLTNQESRVKIVILAFAAGIGGVKQTSNLKQALFNVRLLSWKLNQNHLTFDPGRRRYFSTCSSSSSFIVYTIFLF